MITSSRICKPDLQWLSEEPFVLQITLQQFAVTSQDCYLTSFPPVRSKSTQYWQIQTTWPSFTRNPTAAPAWRWSLGTLQAQDLALCGSGNACSLPLSRAHPGLRRCWVSALPQSCSGGRTRSRCLPPFASFKICNLGPSKDSLGTTALILGNWAGTKRLDAQAL